MSSIQKITPNFWFDTQAEDAAKFYTSVFPDSSIGRISHYGKEGFGVQGMREGMVMAAEFTLAGQSLSQKAYDG